MRRACLVGLAALLGAAVGCGEKPPKLVSVTGKAVHNGKPLTAGSLTFHPESGVQEKGDRPSCQLQSDGGFTAQTFPYGDGMPPGAYKVTLSKELASRINRPQLVDPARTPLKVTVPEDGIHDLTLDVK